MPDHNGNSTLGGKAAALAALRDAGFAVPLFEVSPVDLEAACERVGFPLAVRSSATVEDGARTSFAGQFCSVLNVRTVEAAAQAISRVEASARETAVVEYCRRHGIDPAAVRMRVIVQAMVSPVLAGMAFTVNPATGADEVVIEACEGLADELLLGRVTPLERGHEVLKRYRGAIEAVARNIQLFFGCPQDVEFAVDGDGMVWVLQARPVTRIEFGAGIGEWTNADFRDGGVSSAVCSPLMWSLYEVVWEKELKGFLREIRLLKDGGRGCGGASEWKAGRMFFGRPYWNVGEVKKCLARLPGFVEREFDEDLQIEPGYDGDGVRTPVTLTGVVRALPTLWALGTFFKRHEAVASRWLRRGVEGLEAGSAVRTMACNAGPATSAKDRRDGQGPHSGPYEAAFRALIEGGFVRLEGDYFRTIFAASMAKLDLKESFPDADYAALAAGLPAITHMAPLKMMREMKGRGERDIDAILARFAHHGSRGLDIIQPRWDEDRGFVEAVFDRIEPADMSGDPSRASRLDRRTASATPVFDEARRAMAARLPWWKRGKFERKLARLRRFVWLREEMRDLSSRVYHAIRKLALAVGRQRGIGEDVFFMTFGEVIVDDRSKVQERRLIYDGYRNFAAPNEVVGKREGPGASADGGDARGGLRGIGASRGSVTGVARVAGTAAEAMGVERGAVLVCPFTDPGWTVVLDRVGGVVTEVGGLLSHAAVICREYGIPAVLGVKDATRILRDGQPVTVDGDEGVVRLE